MSRTAFAVAIMLLVASCKKTSTSDPNSHPAAGDVALNFSVDVNKPGRLIPLGFTGLSYEAGAIPNPAYFSDSNTTFVNLIKELGQGVFRIGGNTVDRSPWVAVASSGVNLDKVITDQDLDRLFKFTGATGWKVMFGLNLGTGTPRYAALEAAYIYSHYPDQLFSFEIGNEPDFYGNNGLRPIGYSNTDFEKDFTVFYDSIRGRTPEAVFSGPTTATHTMTWLEPFVRDEASHIQMVTQHYYKMGPASSPAVTIEKLLDGNSGIISQAETMKAVADVYHLPYRIAECNSVFGGGKGGVSNTLASALWGLDLMFVLAEHGAAGVNFHHGGKDTDWYNPIEFYQGQFIPKPLYYGMLLFSKAADGNLLSVSADTLRQSEAFNLVVHAVKRQNGAVLVTLINKDLSRQAFVTLTIHHPGWQSASLLRLTGGSPADTSVMLGGAAVDAEGHWTPQQVENATLTKNGCTVKMPPYSAALLVLQ
ncbi:MAG: hypothetical protein BGO55_19755 [Sphingobacteriales bacterium 50-39]|nr:hypothetical protein [Sphingobacteriales bacterium]OJW58944.1 MAG: hypothetical protein BGO55_19755 [Sphingobacteriales bacterium 50-39]